MWSVTLYGGFPFQTLNSVFSWLTETLAGFDISVEILFRKL